MSLRQCIRRLRYASETHPWPLGSRKGFPVSLKMAKGREVLSLTFMCENSRTVMIVSFFLISNKNVLLVSKAQSEPDVYDIDHKILVILTFAIAKNPG